MRTRPRRIGLTGNIGSGKSTVARMLCAKGAALIDADALAKEASEAPEVLAAIARDLGPELVQNGRLERDKTAQRIFHDAQARQRLNSIIHPWVRRESAKRVRDLEGRSEPPEVIVLDIPLLFENDLERELDAVIVVDAPLELRAVRVAARSGLAPEEVRARDAAQLPLSEKVLRADFVLDNSGSETDLSAQVDRLWPRLMNLGAKQAGPGL